MSTKQHFSEHNFLGAYSLQGTGLSLSVVSLFIPTVILSPTQLRIITPFLDPQLSWPSSLCHIIIITLPQIPSFVQQDSLFSTCIKQMNLAKTNTKPPETRWLISLSIYVHRSQCDPSCFLGVILFFIPQLSKRTVSFLLFPQASKPPPTSSCPTDDSFPFHWSNRSSQREHPSSPSPPLLTASVCALVPSPLSYEWG